MPRDRIPVCVFALKPHDTNPLDISCLDANASRALSRVLLTSFSETGAKSAWRCVLKHLPPSQPEPRIFCMTSDSRNTTFVIQCCNKEDFCNRDLKPQLHPSNNEGIVQTDLEVTKSLQVARALAATFVSHFSSFFFFFLCIPLALQHAKYILAVWIYYFIVGFYCQSIPKCIMNLIIVSPLLDSTTFNS